MLPTRALTGIFVINGDDYKWELRREPHWCTADGWQGMQIAVRAAKVGGREALLQFPMPQKAAQRARGKEVVHEFESTAPFDASH